jgi:hypothetical protein
MACGLLLHWKSVRFFPRAAAALLLAGSCARAPAVSPAQTPAIFEDARALLQKYPDAAVIEAGAWPGTLKALHPRSVRSRAEGLYVVTSSRWVTEHGVFVPRDPDGFSPEAGTDPEYRLVANAVYVYRIRG